MTTIVTRKGIIRWSRNPLPPEIAYSVCDAPGAPVRMVTWDEVMDIRRQRQREILECKRRGHPQRRAYRLLVRYFDQWCYGGWQTYVDGINDSRWVDQNAKWLQGPLMAAFPVLGPTLFEIEDEYSRWERWEIKFAEQYRRREQCGRPVGVAYVWWDGESAEVEPAKEKAPSVVPALPGRAPPTATGAARRER